MQRKFFSLIGVLVLGAALVAVPGIGQDLSSSDAGAQIAASTIALAQWQADPSSVSDAELFALLADGNHVTAVGRAFVMQRILAVGDPALGEFDGQTYLDAAANGDGASDEQNYAWARAGVFTARDGFGAVPGGPTESFNRLQTCLNDSNLQSNQDGLAAGFSLDCSSGFVRQAVAEMIAIGFYQQFGALVGVDCAFIEDQISSGGTPEAQYAAIGAFIEACSAGLNGEELGAIVGLAATPTLARDLQNSSASTDSLLSQFFADPTGLDGVASVTAAGLRLVDAGNTDQVVPVFGDLNSFATLFGDFGAFGSGPALVRTLDDGAFTVGLGIDNGSAVPFFVGLDI